LQRDVLIGVPEASTDFGNRYSVAGDDNSSMACATADAQAVPES
jgi:hypothetical protein